MVELAKRGNTVAYRFSELSGVLHLRTIAVCIGLALATALTFALGLTIGDYPVTLSQVIQSLLGNGNPGTDFIVLDLRMPRVLVGVLVGAAFGISGALFQTLTRNPLASPDTIGLTAGASTAVVAGIVLGFGAGLGTQLLGLLGALTAAVAIYLLAWKRGTTGYRIVLVGIAVSWMFVSATNYLLAKAQLWEAQQVMQWIIGSMNARDWVHVRPLAWAVLVLVPATLLLARWLRLMQLGDDVAIALGVPVRFARVALLAAGVGLVAFATAATGPIAFVALTAPQIAQRLVGLSWPPLVASGLAGSVMVLGSDLLAQRLFPDLLLPIGVVTGAIGGVFLLWLLTRANRVGTGG